MNNLISLINNNNKKNNHNNFLNLIYNRESYEICKILELEGYIKDLKVRNVNRNKKISFLLNMNNNTIKLISTSGRRVYISNRQVGSLNNTRKKTLNQSKISIKEIFSYNDNLYIIRTSKGLLTEKEAIKLNIGGELIIKVKNKNIKNFISK